MQEDEFKSKKSDIDGTEYREMQEDEFKSKKSYIDGNEEKKKYELWNRK